MTPRGSWEEKEETINMNILPAKGSDVDNIYIYKKNLSFWVFNDHCGKKTTKQNRPTTIVSPGDEQIIQS